ncbi:MAG: Smr/MutS family protein [Thermodesulfobacteriota bacterium]
MRSGPFHNPFRDQAKDLSALVARPAPAPPAPKPSPADEDEEGLWLKAMSEVRPLDAGPLTAQPKVKPPVRPAENEDLEVLTHLADLVSGNLPLDVRDTDEYVEGARPGLNPALLSRLSEGFYPVQEHLDLHGLNLTQAEARVARFLHESRRRGLRCVLIIHGRGLKSPDRHPVLKPHLVDWLSRSGMRKHVLAFTSARPYDGGAGAVYVLLKG